MVLEVLGCRNCVTNFMNFCYILWYDGGMEKYIDLKLNNLINLRNIYAAVIMALTGYLFGTFETTNSLIMFCTGFLDVIFMLHYYKVNKSIGRILNVLRRK